MVNQIYEHLKTRKKYNTLKVKYDVKCDELEEKILQYNTEKKIKCIQKNLYEQQIREITEKNLELQKEIVKLKKNIKEYKKGEKDGTKNTESREKTKEVRGRKTKN